MELSPKQLLELEQKVSAEIVKIGSIFEKNWEKKRTVTFKDRNEPVSQLDPIIENKLRIFLQKLLLHSGFYVEEGKNSEEKEYMWTIDPIDGTNNFIGHIPLFTIQVALVYKNEPIIGVLYNPISKQLFSASKKNGSRENGKTVVEQTRTNLDKAFIDLDFGGHNNGLYWKLPVFKVLSENCNRVRSSGGLYGPYIVFGGIDAFVVLNERTKIVDQMPRIIWMKEAGLQVEQLQIKEHKLMLVANKDLFPKVKKLIIDAIEK